jgi:hypothetical protein
MATLLGKGTTLSLGGSPIANVVSINGPKREVGTVETTNLSSDERTFRPTILDNGTLDATIQFDPSSHSTIEALLDASPLAADTWSVDLSDGTTSYSFSGILTSFELDPAGSVDDLSMANISIKISGPIT